MTSNKTSGILTALSVSIVTPTAGLCVLGDLKRCGVDRVPKGDSMPRYRVTGGPSGDAGISYKLKRAEVGDVVDDIPRDSVKWLREQGYIEVVGKDDTSTTSSSDSSDLADEVQP